MKHVPARTVVAAAGGAALIAALLAIIGFAWAYIGVVVVLWWMTMYLRGYPPASTPTALPGGEPPDRRGGTIPVPGKIFEGAAAPTWAESPPDPESYLSPDSRTGSLRSRTP